MRLKNFGMRLADAIAAFVGSWTFIIIQSIVLIIWVFVNLHHLVHFDPYPFILMNLFLSFQAAYATPMILMSSNRQAVKDNQPACGFPHGGLFNMSTQPACSCSH